MRTAEALLNRILAPLQLRWMYRPQSNVGLVIAPGNVWSRTARRKLGRGESLLNDADEFEPALGVKIKLEIAGDGLNIGIRWVKGSDSVLGVSDTLYVDTLCLLVYRSSKVCGVFALHEFHRDVKLLHEDWHTIQTRAPIQHSV